MRRKQDAVWHEGRRKPPFVFVRAAILSTPMRARANTPQHRPSLAVLAGKACPRPVAVAKLWRESGFTLLT